MPVNPLKPRKLTKNHETVLAKLREHGQWLVHADYNMLGAGCRWQHREIWRTREYLNTLVLRGLVRSRRLPLRPQIIQYTLVPACDGARPCRAKTTLRVCVATPRQFCQCCPKCRRSCTSGG